MPLDSLHVLVKTLKERIATHGPALRASEALTRYALIDPLLRELGWDTANPSLVIPEYQSGNGRADYALLGNDGNPAMMVEAKSLGSSLRDAALSQGIQYCLEKGTKHFALTDGSIWEIYETHRPVPIEEKRVIEIDLSRQPTTQVCLQALALWRPSLEEGSADAGLAPLIQPKVRSDALEPTTPVQDEHEWHSLLELKPSKGDTPPAEIRYPDDSCVTVKYWNGVVVEIVRWLVRNGQLHFDNCPIRQADSSARYLVSNDAVHPTGKRFFSGEQVETVWVEKDYIIPQLVENARTIIACVGLNPEHFVVRFD